MLLELSPLQWRLFRKHKVELKLLLPQNDEEETSDVEDWIYQAVSYNGRS